MKYCKKCGLPENYVNIQLDEDGICNYCHFYDKHKEVLNNQLYLEEVFAKQVELAKKKARENGAEYDCLIGLSGGKDSTYIIYQLKHHYGMRVLAYTFQNGFQTDYAVRNIKNALEKLDVDHITITKKASQLRKEYQACIKLANNFCSVCFHNMHYYSYQIAMEKKIPLIVNGRTKGQVYQSALDTKGIEPFELSDTLCAFEYQMFGPLLEKVKKLGKLDYLEAAKVTALSYFVYHDISEEETKNFLAEHIGWEKPKETAAHPDCFAHEAAEHMSIQKRGCPIRQGELAVLVRMGKMTMEEAEKELAKDVEQYQNVNRQVLEQVEAYIKKDR